MTLELEKLTNELESMAATAARQQLRRREQLDRLRDLMGKHAVDWAGIDLALEKAAGRADPKYFRAARPLDDSEPLDEAIPAPPAPAHATLIAVDGSQILPDRHAAFLYYLINIGSIVYHHGANRAPATSSEPVIKYPSAGDGRDEDDELALDANRVSTERDLAEITTLAGLAWDNRDAQRPLLALLDQRLLYFPYGGVEAAQVREKWLVAMTQIHDSGGYLAGYIDRPGKRSVITMLQTLAEPDVDWDTLGKRAAGDNLTDVGLYAGLLGPGERSRVYVDISPVNRGFAEIDPDNEVCFFYLNPGLSGPASLSGDALARVDIPLWVARDAATVGMVHALLVDQCAIIGGYPYVLTRADEQAVVGRRDEADLNQRIDVAMQRQGIFSDVTGKQASKDAARGARSRMERL